MEIPLQTQPRDRERESAWRTGAGLYIPCAVRIRETIVCSCTARNCINSNLECCILSLRLNLEISHVHEPRVAPDR